MSKPPIAKKRAMESGQSLVEMALGMVFFLFFVLGMLDLGRLYFVYVAMEDGAGEAALYLALNAACPEASAGPACADPNNAMWRAEHASSGQIDFSWDDVRLDYAVLAASGTDEARVEVGIEYDFHTLTPIINSIAGDLLTLRAEASHVRLLD